MAARVRISGRTIDRVMLSGEVRAALTRKGQQVASRANALGASEGVDMDATVEPPSVRPKGRPQVRVLSYNTEQEWGSRHVERRRIFGRVAEEYR